MLTFVHANIQAALKQIRTARRQNKVSAEYIARIMRRLGLMTAHDKAQKEIRRASLARWENMMALAREVLSEVQPELDKVEQAERSLFSGMVRTQNESHILDQSITRRIAAPVLVGEEYTEAWFKKQARIERKAARQANKATEVSEPSLHEEVEEMFANM